MKTRIKVAITVIAAVFIIIIGVGTGSVFVPPLDILRVIASKLAGFALPENLAGATADIIWKMRLPRVLMAFLVGGALSASGTVMQSVLRNPLASSYTLGVSSGAALGAGIIMLTGFTLPFIGVFTLPLAGLIFGIVTVFVAIIFATGVDRNMENNTIILTGMVLSLFISSIITVLYTFNHEFMQRILYWQMGSFSSKNWGQVAILLPVFLAGLFLLLFYSKELDIMTFGEEQAKASGVDLKRVKWTLLVITAIMTGSAISFVGIIGFVDLIAPHIVRKIFGSNHRLVLPMSALFGGAFMVVADVISRTVIAPAEMPVGAVTALVGAPFFAYIYFIRRRRA